MGRRGYGENTPCIAVSRLGSPRQAMRADTLKNLVDYESGDPLHSLVILGNKVHDLETDFIVEFARDAEELRKAIKDDSENFKKPAPVFVEEEDDDE